MMHLVMHGGCRHLGLSIFVHFVANTSVAWCSPAEASAGYHEASRRNAPEPRIEHGTRLGHVVRDRHLRCRHCREANRSGNSAPRCLAESRRGTARVHYIWDQQQKAIPAPVARLALLLRQRPGSVRIGGSIRLPCDSLAALFPSLSSRWDWRWCAAKFWQDIKDENENIMLLCQCVGTHSSFMVFEFVAPRRAPL